MKEIDFNYLAEVVCGYYGVCREKVMIGRQKHLVRAKEMYSYLAREYYHTKSFNYIGSYMGIDHATIIHHHNKISGYLPYYNVVRQDIDNIFYLIDSQTYIKMDMSEKIRHSYGNLGIAYVNDMEVDCKIF